MQYEIEKVRQSIRDAVKSVGTVIITSPTGSGKSTQVPRMLLDCVPGRILVLQPRRIAARMLAERVAFEMGEEVGKCVGYHTRYERQFSKETRILFVTEGILTRMLADAPELPGIGAVVFDEFHERSLNTDLGLAMAWHSKSTLRHDLCLVVMSATMDATSVSRFLDSAPVISAEGRNFKVDISYCTQEEKLMGPADAAARALSRLVLSGAEGDVLIFMPGGREIRQTIDACSRLSLGEPLEILPLYGDLPPGEQRRVMNESGKRKVIVATNIAETSLTIPGVRHVIDSGLARMARYSAVRGIDVLETVPIARDSAEQRAGRAGRIADGTCHRLWSWLEHSAKSARTAPEIQRVDLAEAVLAVNAFGFHDALQFPWFERPQEKQIILAERLLEQLGAISPGHGGVTELGRKLRELPIHPRLALLMWHGSQRHCLELTAWTVAILSSRPLLLTSAAPRNSRPHSTLSDILEQIHLLKAAKEADFAQDFCQLRGINSGAAREIFRMKEDCLVRARHAGWSGETAENAEESLVQCLLLVFPDRLARKLDNGLWELALERHAELEAASVVNKASLLVAAELREGVGSHLRLGLASQVDEDWLLELFPDSWDDIDEAFWDERQQRVLRRQKLYCLGVCLEEKVRNAPVPEKAAEILAGMLNSGKLPLPWEREAVDKWISRVQWVAKIFPEKHLPDYSDLMPSFREVCYGEYSLKGLKNRDWFAAVKNMLTFEQQRFVEAMAPAFIMLPNGRRMKVDYVPGTTPRGHSRIQDFYDVKETPTVAGGRVRILLDILAPNNRTVQITDDLANFWRELYPKIRTELSRRYPRHLWK